MRTPFSTHEALEIDLGRLAEIDTGSGRLLRHLLGDVLLVRGLAVRVDLGVTAGELLRLAPLHPAVHSRCRPRDHSGPGHTS